MSSVDIIHRNGLCGKNTFSDCEIDTEFVYLREVASERRDLLGIGRNFRSNISYLVIGAASPNQPKKNMLYIEESSPLICLLKRMIRSKL